MAVDFACIYGKFDPAVPLEPGSPSYVDWQAELGLNDVKRQLVNSVRLMPDRPVHRLFTGHRGGGKTTELKRVRERLQSAGSGDRYFVSYLDADDTIDLDDVDATDLVLAIVRQLIGDASAQEGITVTLGKKFHAFLEAARHALDSVPDAGVALKVGDPAGIAELSTTLKRQPSIRRQVRRLLEGPLTTLFDAVNDEVLPDLRRQLQGKGFAGLLVIVDQLDRIPAEGDRHRQIFWESRGKLKALDCHIVYTAPIEYASSRALPTLENEYGELLGLPLLPVTADEESVRDAAITCMGEVVDARLKQCGVAWNAVFETAGALDELIRLSGGHLRSLFHLLRTGIETSDLVAPLGDEHLATMARSLAAKYLEPLTAKEREVVKLVHETRERPNDDGLLDCFFDLLRDQYVFAYLVEDRRWYDWNPLLARSPLVSP